MESLAIGRPKASRIEFRALCRSELETNEFAPDSCREEGGGDKFDRLLALVTTEISSIRDLLISARLGAVGRGPEIPRLNDPRADSGRSGIGETARGD